MIESFFKNGMGFALNRAKVFTGLETMRTQTLKEREKEHLQKVLEKTGWDLEKTAHLLQTPLSQVKRKIREHGIVTEKSGIDK